MVTQMKKYLVAMIDHGKRFSKAWDYACISNDAFGAGYQYARANPDSEELVEYEFKNGDHQLSSKTFKKWHDENYNLSFEESLKSFLIHYTIEDVLVHVDNKGTISFQGLAKKKDPTTVKVEDDNG